MTAVKERQSLHFWTDGENFTNLLVSFWQEGQYKKVYDILTDGGLKLMHLAPFFERRAHFTGTTQFGEDLNYKIEDNKPEDFEEQLFWSIKNCYVKNRKYEIREDVENGEWYEYKVAKPLEDFLNDWDCEDLRILNRFFKREYIERLMLRSILNENGYDLNPLPEYKNIDGCITKEGDYITCGYQEHMQLYPLLYKLGLTDSNEWTSDKTSFHISSGQMSGGVSFALSYPDRGDREQPTQAQLDTLMKYRDNIRGNYGEYKSTAQLILNYNKEIESMGGKYGNLMFLKKYYPEIKLPKFSKSPLEVEKQCIRTSPKFSLPGLLHSKFDITDESIKEIEADFEKFKDVREGNELHYFYQEFIEGLNGVCHYWGRREFEYAVSDQQGAIVQGNKGNQLLDGVVYGKLRSIASLLNKDINQPIQLEFVVQGEEVYIVQLRILENNSSNTVIYTFPKNIIIQGITFCKGEVECDLKDVLIVEEDSDSEKLLGKKALIVTNEVEFSHILALSKALNIPSIFATGELPKLPNKIKIVAHNLEAFICKI